MLTASQVYGSVHDAEGDETPFRINSATSSELTVNGGGAGTYQRNLGDDSTVYTTNTNLHRELSGNTRDSSWVAIVGDYGGYSLSKSQGALTDDVSIALVDDNGTTSSSGTFERSSSGSTDTMVKISGSTSPETGTQITVEAVDNSGAEFSDGYAGSFSEDSSGSSELATGGSYQKVFGQSLNKTSVFKTDASGSSLLTMTDNSKFLVTSSNDGSVETLDDEVVASSGSVSSDRMLRVSSDMGLFATSQASDGNTTSSSTQTFSSSDKFSLVAGSGGTSSEIDGQSHTEGGLHSETSGSSQTSGSMQAKVKTADGSSSESVSLVSSFGSSASMKETLGGTFIDDATTLNAGSSNQSSSSNKSTITIAAQDDSSSSNQTITQSDSSGSKSGSNLSVMEFGEIVGSESGGYHSSSHSGSVVTIQSSGNSRSGDTNSWQSRNTTVSSGQKFSLTGTFYGLEGSDDGATDQTDGPLSQTVWSVSSQQTVSGTMASGSLTDTSNAVNTGFRREQSTQNLSMNSNFSIGSANTEGTTTQSWGMTTHAIDHTVSASIPDESGTQTAHANLLTQDGSIASSEVTRGDDVQRTYLQSNKNLRIVSDQTTTDDYLDSYTARLSWGDSTEVGKETERNGDRSSY